MPSEIAKQIVQQVFGDDKAKAMDSVNDALSATAYDAVQARKVEFAKAMGTRADELVSARKEEIANAIFNDPELQKMGLEAAPEVDEELEQTETDTGETNEDI